MAREIKGKDKLPFYFVEKAVKVTPMEAPRVREALSFIGDALPCLSFMTESGIIMAAVSTCGHYYGRFTRIGDLLVSYCGSSSNASELIEKLRRYYVNILNNPEVCGGQALMNTMADFFKIDKRDGKIFRSAILAACWDYPHKYQLYKADPFGCRGFTYMAVGRNAEVALNIIRHGYKADLSFESSKYLAVKALMGAAYHGKKGERGIKEMPKLEMTFLKCVDLPYGCARNAGGKATAMIVVPEKEVEGIIQKVLKDLQANN